MIYKLPSEKKSMVRGKMDALCGKAAQVCVVFFGEGLGAPGIVSPVGGSSNVRRRGSMSGSKISAG